MMVVLRVQVNSTAPSMQIAIAGLVFALVQILFSAECKILSICTSEKQVFTCASGTTTPENP